MFCPKCATQNVEGASYCRSCGANISLVPQALSGQLPTAAPVDNDYYYGRRWRRGTPSMDHAVRSLTMGIAFALMAALTSKFAPGSGRWWFWLLVPAMLMFSRGFAELVRVRGTRNRIPTASQPELKSAPPLNIPSAQTGELMTAAPSVTEDTTRHLEGAARTRQL